MGCLQVKRKSSELCDRIQALILVCNDLSQKQTALIRRATARNLRCNHDESSSLETESCRFCTCVECPEVSFF